MFLKFRDPGDGRLMCFNSNHVAAVLPAQQVDEKTKQKTAAIGKSIIQVVGGGQYVVDADSRAVYDNLKLADRREERLALAKRTQDFESEDEPAPGKVSSIVRG
jgi:hypothetical protein